MRATQGAKHCRDPIADRKDQSMIAFVVGSKSVGEVDCYTRTCFTIVSPPSLLPSA